MTRDEAQALLDSCELHALLGLELVQFEEGRVRFSFAPPASVRSEDGGSIHGGALATALDTAATFAVISSIGADATTIDLRLDYLRPALDPQLTVDGFTLKVGRRFAFADATAVASDGRTVASARGTFTW